MHTKKTFLIDQDGVLADYESRILDIFHNEHPEVPRRAPTQLTYFETGKNYGPEWEEIIDAIALRPGFFLSLSPIEGAIEAIHKIHSLGHDVRICTAPKRKYHHCVGEKFEWVERYLGTTFIEQIVLTRDKTVVHGDILIDDKPNVHGSRHQPSWEHVLFDQTYNRHINNKRRMTWKNYMEILCL